MFGQCRFGPFREGVVFRVVFNHGAVDETDVPPRDDLVKESLHRFGQTPPTLAPSIVGRVDHAHIPAVVGEDVMKNSMNADVAIMEPRRESARPSLLWFIAFFVVCLQAFSEKFLPPAATLNVPAFLSVYRTHIMVDAEG